MYLGYIIIQRDCGKMKCGARNFLCVRVTTRKTPIGNHLVVALVIWPALLLLSSSAGLKTVLQVIPSSSAGTVDPLYY